MGTAFRDAVPAFPNPVFFWRFYYFAAVYQFLERCFIQLAKKRAKAFKSAISGKENPSQEIPKKGKKEKKEKLAQEEEPQKEEIAAQNGYNVFEGSSRNKLDN